LHTVPSVYPSCLLLGFINTHIFKNIVQWEFIVSIRNEVIKVLHGDEQYWVDVCRPAMKCDISNNKLWLFHPFDSSLLTYIICCFESSGKEMMMTDSDSRKGWFPSKCHAKKSNFSWAFFIKWYVLSWQNDPCHRVTKSFW
jgi:hypothetical protein